MTHNAIPLNFNGDFVEAQSLAKYLEARTDSLDDIFDLDFKSFKHHEMGGGAVDLKIRLPNRDGQLEVMTMAIDSGLLPNQSEPFSKKFGKTSMTFREIMDYRLFEKDPSDDKKKRLKPGVEPSDNQIDPNVRIHRQVDKFLSNKIDDLLEQKIIARVPDKKPGGKKSTKKNGEEESTTNSQTIVTLPSKEDNYNTMVKDQYVNPLSSVKYSEKKDPRTKKSITVMETVDGEQVEGALLNCVCYDATGLPDGEFKEVQLNTASINKLIPWQNTTVRVFYRLTGLVISKAGFSVRSAVDEVDVCRQAAGRRRQPAHRTMTTDTYAAMATPTMSVVSADDDLDDFD